MFFILEHFYQNNICIVIKYIECNILHSHSNKKCIRHSFSITSFPKNQLRQGGGGEQLILYKESHQLLNNLIKYQQSNQRFAKICNGKVRYAAANSFCLSRLYYILINYDIFDYELINPLSSLVSVTFRGKREKNNLKSRIVFIINKKYTRDRILKLGQRFLTKILLVFLHGGDQNIVCKKINCLHKNE